MPRKADPYDSAFAVSSFSRLKAQLIQGGGEEDEWPEDESRMRYIVIHLPYKVIKGLGDARPFRLARAKERLGLLAGSSLN